MMTVTELGILLRTLPPDAEIRIEIEDHEMGSSPQCFPIRELREREPVPKLDEFGFEDHYRDEYCGWVIIPADFAD